MDYKRLSDISGIEQDTLIKRHAEWSAQAKHKTRPDLKLIAALSGLSISSVSGYLNNKKGAVSKNKARMLDGILSIVDYRPSNAARKLRSTKKMSIGFIAPVTNSPSTEYSVEILKGVKEEARKYNYFVDIYDIGLDETADFTSRLPFLGLVDGLIEVSSALTAESLAPLVQQKIPIFHVNPLREEQRIPFVGSLNSDTSPFTDLLEHLFNDHRYKNPVLIGIPTEGHHQREEKLDLFREMLKKHSVSFNPEKNILFVSSYSFREGDTAWNRIREINPEADVLVCLSDVVAAALMLAQQETRHKIAVTGYGNFDLGESFGLTTVDQHIRELGVEAFQQLFYAMQYIEQQDEFPEYRSLQSAARLIKRKSCACKAGKK
jgi:LacI family transcriptional regulator, purine nucleotide synthesis repressor